MRKILLALIYLITLNPAYAEGAGKAADILVIVEKSGMKTWFHERNEARIAKTNKIIARVNQSIATHTNTLNESQKQALTLATEKLYTSMRQAVSPEEQLRAWVDAFSSGISETEAKQIRDFYESPLGEKLFTSLARASSAISAYNDSASDKLLNDKLNDFLAEANAIINTTK